jgi:hypothetical protein
MHGKWMDREWKEGWMDRWVDGWMMSGGWMDEGADEG